MDSAKTERVRSKLHSLLQFTDKYAQLGNSHMGDILVDDLWEKRVPEEIRNELRDVDSMNELLASYRNLMREPGPSQFSRKYPNVADFLEKANSFSVSNDSSCVMSNTEFENYLIKLNCPKEQRVWEHKDCIPEKKLYEVKVIAKFVSMLRKLTGTSHVVDLGGGRGYLCIALGLQYDCKVLGLESSFYNCHSASKLSQKIAKYFRVTESVDDKNPGASQPNENSRLFNNENLARNYRQVPEYVTNGTNIRSLVERNFMEMCTGISLAGLHTCGDLSPTSLRLFVADPHIRSLVNIGCCYNLLTDEFSDKFPNGTDRESEHGFPVSRYLRERNYHMGKQEKMLAQQSVERYLARIARSDAKRSERSIFYRNLLEVIIRKKNRCKQGMIHDLANRCLSFHEYVRKSLIALDLDIDISDEEIAEIYERHEEMLPVVNSFVRLRLSLAPAIESIIVLDRMLFMLENGVENVFLVRAFDPVISPRGLALIAWKD